MVVAREWGQGNRESVFNGNRDSVLQDEKVLEVHGGDGCPTTRMCLTPLSCALRNGENGKFYVMSILPQ